MNCDKCKHKNVCKFEDMAREYELALSNIDNKPEFIFIGIKCKNFTPFEIRTKKQENVGKE